MTASSSFSSVTSVPEVQVSESSDWAEIEKAFGAAPSFQFSQSWREGDEAGFRAGTVKMGWRGEHFLVFAELKDDLVMTRATARNEMLYTLGDVFEVFAGVKGNGAYIEYHVAPNNTILQLSFTEANAFKSGAAKFLRIENDSVLKARKVAGGWQVFAAIHKDAVSGSAGSLKGHEWEVNFGRYDYSKQGLPPVLSSTSPLTALSFHRRMEWRTIRFE